MLSLGGICVPIPSEQIQKWNSVFYFRKLGDRYDTFREIAAAIDFLAIQASAAGDRRRACQNNRATPASTLQ
jgi:hypothetical protein